jgi:hypothetical protein
MPETIALGSKASPTLAMSAPGASTVGGAIAASSLAATLAGSSGLPSGTISFTVFGPQASAPALCTSGGTTFGTALPGGDGPWNPSAGFTPTTAGTYWWYASFAGDTFDNSAVSKCNNVTMSSTVVGKASPALVTAGPSTGTVGAAIPTSAISATMSASSGAGATGLITFKVFGPQAAAPTSPCAGGTTLGTTVAPAGDGTYHPTATYTPGSAGTYWWFASFAGDTNDNSTSTCGGTMGSTVVGLPDTFLVANPGPQTAGQAFNVNVTAQLAAGGQDFGYNGIQTIVFTGPANSPNGTPPTYPATVFFTNGAGVANITLFNAASTTLTATQAAITGTSTAFTVNAKSASALCIVSAASCSGSAISGGHGFTFTSKVGLIDQYSNPATSASSVTVSVVQTGNGGGVTTSGSMTIVAGQTLTPGTFTGTASGASGKTATDTATSVPALTAATVIQNT